MSSDVNLKCEINVPPASMRCDATADGHIQDSPIHTTTAFETSMYDVFRPLLVTAGAELLPEGWTRFPAEPTSESSFSDNSAHRTAVHHALVTGLAVAAGGALVL